VQLAEGEGFENEKVERALKEIGRHVCHGVVLSTFCTKMRASYRVSIGRWGGRCKESVLRGGWRVAGGGDGFDGIFAAS
jgi:hypothetical protein